MSEKKIAEMKESFEDMLEKLEQGNQIAIMLHGRLIKAVEYDKDTMRMIEVILRAVIRGLEK